MAIVKLNNRAVKDATAVGSTTQLGNLIFISKQTASSSASVSFTSGIDSTYKEYIFYFNNIHPQNGSNHLTFQCSTDGGSNYNTTITSTLFRAYHLENDTGAALNYITSSDYNKVLPINLLFKQLLLIILMMIICQVIYIYLNQVLQLLLNILLVIVMLLMLVVGIVI